jgi:hypothetical protein
VFHEIEDLLDDPEKIRTADRGLLLTVAAFAVQTAREISLRRATELVSQRN